jgi:hypothetical protein
MTKAWTIKLFGAPYSDSFGELADRQGFSTLREVGKYADAVLNKGQDLIVYDADGLPVAKWVCGPDNIVRRVNL